MVTMQIQSHGERVPCSTLIAAPSGLAARPRDSAVNRLITVG
jgi:hypothetical protein